MKSEIINNKYLNIFLKIKKLNKKKNYFIARAII